jgi:hypothetical protein
MHDDDMKPSAFCGSSRLLDFSSLCQHHIARVAALHHAGAVDDDLQLGVANRVPTLSREGMVARHVVCF